MVVKGASTAVNPVRLQTVKKLRVQRPITKQASPCTGPMSAMLNCWASSAAQTAAGASQCMALEQALRECMDFSRSQVSKKNDINCHLQKLWPKIRGPQKRDGVFK